MSSKVFSIIVKCWYNTQPGATHLQVVRIDTAEQEMSFFATDLLSQLHLNIITGSTQRAQLYLCAVR